jgi:small subunit ribosomal protein S6e
MADFKLVISDPKIKKAYQVEIKSPDADRLIGLKLGQTFKGDLINLPGFELQITGGSDKQGFPMRKDVLGTKRIKALVSGGTGFKPKREGQRKRKSLRGNQIADDIAQINCKVTVWGAKSLGIALGKEEEKTAEAKADATKKETESESAKKESGDKGKEENSKKESS